MKNEKLIGIDEIILYYFKALYFVVKKSQCVHEETVFGLGKTSFQPLYKGLGEVNA